MTPTENLEALRGAGLIDDEGEPLPDEYYDLIEELSSDEVEALVAIKQRLVEREITIQPLTAGYAAVNLHVLGPVF